ncbi:hypothetical protein NFX46_38000 [Streptomyces phaeoluteigriseus]|uniref:Uncharacterized protein n=1 Tax=Streptomyces phaeoluteigriseus TaxID=114686 RepID=A0ABY4ZJ38_9ACTN|nr:hypothetical protein [Streptomyces phaeoluteigriseus]USQ89034.1 hypothetical protein NFX46_38000 [Streptomyces phaeoluteigriseus]
MAKARSHGLPQRKARTDNLPAVGDLTVGKYTFMPGTAYSALTAQGATARGDARVERQVTEPLLREFLALLEEIQEELDSRWNGQENSGRRVQRVTGTYFHES